MTKKLFPGKGTPASKINEIMVATQQNDLKIAYVERQIESVNKQVARMDSDDWKWLVEEYLPCERHRIANRSLDENVINPMDPAKYEREHLIAYGQAKECAILIGRLKDLRLEQAKLQHQLAAFNEKKRNLLSQAAAVHKEIEKEKKRG